MKTGDMLWSYARGIDIREVEPAQVHALSSPSKSIIRRLVVAGNAIEYAI